IVEISQRRVQPRIVRSGFLEPRDRLGVLPRAHVGVGQQGDAVLPSALTIDEIAQQRNRLVEGGRADVEAREVGLQIRIGLADGSSAMARLKAAIASSILSSRSRRRPRRY